VPRGGFTAVPILTTYGTVIKGAEGRYQQFHTAVPISTTYGTIIKDAEGRFHGCTHFNPI
jgi:hypothetical protein